MLIEHLSVPSASHKRWTSFSPSIPSEWFCEHFNLYDDDDEEDDDKDDDELDEVDDDEEEEEEGEGVFAVFESRLIVKTGDVFSSVFEAVNVGEDCAELCVLLLYALFKSGMSSETLL